jgi:hypothetical protein
MAKKVEPVRVLCAVEGCTNCGPSALTVERSIHTLARTLALRRGWVPSVSIDGAPLVCPSCALEETSREQARVAKATTKERETRASMLRRIHRKMNRRKR